MLIVIILHKTCKTEMAFPISEFGFGIRRYMF